MFKRAILAGAVLAGLAGFAAEDDAMIAFSTPGPDVYADGSRVLDGECYALVWTASGSEFGGIAADGSAVGDSSRVLVIAPAAKDGACPKIYFEVPSSELSALADGTFGVCLLDTRVSGKSAGLDAGGRPKVVNGWGTVAAGSVKVGARRLSLSSALTGTSPAAASSGVTAAAGVTQPKIKGFKVIGDKAYITVENLGGYLSVKGGSTPDANAAIGSAESAPPSGDAVLVRPATGASGFFSVIRN